MTVGQGQDDDPARAVRRGSLLVARLAPEVSLPLSIALAAILLAGLALSVLFVVATAQLIGHIPGAVSDGLDSSAGHALVRALAFSAAAFVLQQVLAPLREAVAEQLGRRLDARVRRRVMASALAPPHIAHLEDPEQLDAIARAQGVGLARVTPGDAVIGLAENLHNQLAVVGAVGVVAYWSPLLALALLACSLVARARLLRAAAERVEVVAGESRALRRADWFRDLALTPGGAKETRVFGLDGWVLERFSAHATTVLRSLWAARRGGGRAVLWLLPGIAAMVAGYLLIADAAQDGDVSLATFAAVTQAILAAGALLVSDSDLLVQYGVAALRPALDLPAGEPARAPAQAPARADIRFAGVSFAYPGTEARVLDGLDLVIEAGRSLAIVGPNGAGKTTLVKLLAGLYEPQGGTIDPPRRRVAAIFQDFVRYELPARDNVGFGALELIGDDEALERAAARAGARDLIDGWPARWDTVLSRSYPDGVEPSGGQWQRIALARALLAAEAGADLLVLDEPTAHLDARAEAELFEALLEATQGTTTLLISHRFSTVRRADRIVVLEGGRIIEDGDHDALMARGGRYAQMFSLQAARFDG